MKPKLLTSLLCLGALAAACTDRTPTNNEQTTIQALNVKPQLLEQRTSPLTNIPVSDPAFVGTLSITRLAYNEVSKQLLFTGTVTRAADGAVDKFTDVPGTLSQTQAALGPMQTPIFGTNYALVSMLCSLSATASAQGPCPILFLDLQPLHLDLLGLVVDLNAVVLNLHADQGPNNLLGNLLCSLTGLLSGPTVTGQITALVDRINGILTALGI